VQTQGGTSEIKWNGMDEYRQTLPGGAYHIVMQVDDELLDTITVIKN